MNDTFYWSPEAPGIDWESDQSLVLANPEWAKREPGSARAVERRLPTLRGHVWVATSGSSSAGPGGPRWVALSKSAFLASATAVNAHLSATAADVWAHALPVFHVGGLGILARAWLAGSRVVAAIAERWDAGRYLRVLRETHATLSALVPAQVHDLVAAGLASPPSVRAVVVGGARLDGDLYRQARRLGWPCLPSYGLTETCSQVATASLASLSSGDLPEILPVLSHAAIRATRAGRLSVRASSLLTCCAVQDGEGMRVWDPRRRGWLGTDDRGRMHEGGVEVFGRASESVKVLGELVSLLRIEEVVRRWVDGEPDLRRAVLDLAVVAPPHRRLGHELVLVLAGGGRPRSRPGRGGRLQASLDTFSRDTLMPVERPQRVVWLPRIPRTTLGKVQRQLLSREVEGA